jgi:hypothetical protein
MLALRTVEPHWLVILDADSVGQDVGGRSESSVGGHEARVEGVGLVGDHILDRYAWLIEGRLGNRVILKGSLALITTLLAWYIYLRVELELDHVSGLRPHVGWGEYERTVGSTDVDDVCVDHACGCSRAQYSGRSASEC